MSDETKWTPGPWVFVRYTEANKEGEKRKFGVTPKAELAEGIRFSDIWKEHDAHLIAAAPDMADALMCWPLSELLGMVEDSGDAAMRERAKWFMEVRDYALAKARGES